MASLDGYLTGWAVLAAVLLPPGWAAVETRRWLLGSWRGTWARLAESIVAAVLVLLIAEALGLVGLFNRTGLVLGGLIIGGCVAVLTRRQPRRPAQEIEVPAEPRDPWALGGAVVAVGAVGAQWMAWTAQALRHGMTAYDAVFYHGPIAARFAQTADLTRFHAVVPGEAISFYPATTEVWHAIGIVAFHTDLVSPVLNLGALVIAVLAAWCFGRRLGGGPGAVAAVALVCAMPYVAASQPGSSFNDAAALAALLAAVALFTRAADEPGAGLIGALAGGLAIGIKLSFVAPAVLVALACCWLLPRGRRLGTVTGWAATMVVAGGFWYARNLVRIGNPLPGIGLGLPTPALPVDQRYGTRLLSSLDLSAHGWRTLYRVGLQDYFGRAWPGMAIVVVAGVAAGLFASRRSWHRAGSLVVAASLLAYTVTPVTGDPAFFRFNLRYTLPIQGVAVLVLTTHPRLVGRWSQRIIVAVTGVGLVLAWPGPPPGADPYQLAAWPAGAGHRLAAVAVTVAILGLAAGGWALCRVAPRAAAAAVAAVALAGALTAGRAVEDRFLRGRYQHLSGELAASWQWAQGVQHSRIGVVGLYQQYPYFGPRIDNVVQYVGIGTAHGGFARAPTCAVYRATVNAGRYAYIVTSREGIFPPPGEPPEAAWTRQDPSAREILHTGDTAVFRLSGLLHPTACRG